MPEEGEGAGAPSNAGDSSANESGSGGSSEGGSDKSDGSDNTNAAGGNANSGSGGSGGAAEKEPHCPAYTILQHGVGSWFEHGFSSDGRSYTERRTIVAVREEADGTHVAVATKIDSRTPNSSSLREEDSIFVCNGDGARLLSRDITTTLTGGSGTPAPPMEIDYGDGILVMVWNAGPGSSWTSSPKVMTTSDGDTTSDDRVYDYEMPNWLEIPDYRHENYETPAGTFDAVTVGYKVFGGPRQDRLFDKTVGFVKMSALVLQAYEIK